VHPRTRRQINQESSDRLILVEPLGYLEFLSLMEDAAVIMTDSGGIQEEAMILGVPCVTLRENTERPITLTGGANVLVGRDTKLLVRETLAAVRGERRGSVPVPEKWDGNAAERAAEVLAAWFD